jgi:hypothetical protein
MYPRDCSFLVAIRMVPFGNPYLLGHTTQAPEREAARTHTALSAEDCALRATWPPQAAGSHASPAHM